MHEKIKYVFYSHSFQVFILAINAYKQEKGVFMYHARKLYNFFNLLQITSKVRKKEEKETQSYITF